MAAFVFKLFTLSLKTISKPLASRFQTYALNHPTLRAHAISIAQVRRITGEKKRTMISSSIFPLRPRIVFFSQPPLSVFPSLSLFALTLSSSYPFQFSPPTNSPRRSDSTASR